MAEMIDLKMIFHNTFSDRDYFEMTHGSRPWHIFLIISKGAFSFVANGQEHFIEKDEIAFFEKNVDFERKIIEPIDFHQFGFFIRQDSPYTAKLKEGKLNIPKSHVRAIIDNLDITTTYLSQESKPIFYRTISNIIIENYLFSTKETTHGAEQDNDIAYVVQYMSDHISETIRIEQIAESIHLSHVGLICKFKKHMKCTPSEFLTKLRMHYAKQLLLENELRINEIARLCGYNNPYYFSTIFKDFYQLSPSQYRQKMLKK